MSARLRSRAATLLLVTIAIGAFACSSTLDAEDYSNDCTNDAECTGVLVGDACDCSCESVAISKRDEERYRSDRRDVGSCGCGAPDCGPCPALVARCAAGRCVMSK